MVEDQRGDRPHASTSLEAEPPGVSFVECRALRLPGAPEPTLGTLLCRHGGALRLVVIAKVALDMKSSTMEAIAPPPIHTADVRRGGTLVVASDLVPGKTRVDVTVDGHLRGGQDQPAGELRGRLALRQNGSTVIDKTLLIPDDPNTGVVPLGYVRVPVGKAPVSDTMDLPRGFGPYGADWPVRRRFLTQPQRALLEAPVMTLADDFDWRFFQAAPPDQQVDQLASNATVVLEGMSADRPRLEAQLPNLQPRGGIVGLDPNAPGRGQDLTFRADSLHIHADQSVCVVSWRAVVELPSEAPALTVTVGIEQLRPTSRERPAGTRAATGAVRKDGRSLPFQPSAGSLHLQAARPATSTGQPARSGNTVGVDEDAVPNGNLPFFETSSMRPAKRKEPTKSLRGTLEPSSRPAPPRDTLPFDVDAQPSPVAPLSPAELGPALSGGTVDLEELKAMGMGALPFGQPMAPTAPESTVPAATPEAQPESASTPELAASPATTDAYAAPTPQEANSAEGQPKRAAERVFRTPSSGDDPLEPSPKRKPAKKKPVQRAQKRTDANALIYQRKS